MSRDPTAMFLVRGHYSDVFWTVGWWFGSIVCGALLAAIASGSVWRLVALFVGTLIAQVLLSWWVKSRRKGHSTNWEAPSTFVARGGWALELVPLAHCGAHAVPFVLLGLNENGRMAVLLVALLYLLPIVVVLVGLSLTVAISVDSARHYGNSWW